MSDLIIPSDRIAEMQAYHDSVIQNPGWQDVATVFDVSLPKLSEDRSDAIGKLSDAYWDVRNGGERQDAPVNEYVQGVISERGDEGLALYYRGVHRLGLIGTRRLIAPADMFVIPAGLVDSNAMRAFDAEVNNIGGKGEKAYVATDRPLNDAERERLMLYAPNAKKVATEADSMLALLEVIHPERELIEGKSDNNFKAYNTPNGRVFWANAPKIEGAARANTRDTYRFLGKMLTTDLKGKTIAIDTNDIFRFQGVDAVHILAGVFGAARIERATFSPETGVELIAQRGFGRIPPKRRDPGSYAQELRSAHNSLLSLKSTIGSSR